MELNVSQSSKMINKRSQHNYAPQTLFLTNKNVCVEYFINARRNFCIDMLYMGKKALNLQKLI